jgi:hypothetical protein
MGFSFQISLISPDWTLWQHQERSPAPPAKLKMHTIHHVKTRSQDSHGADLTRSAYYVFTNSDSTHSYQAHRVEARQNMKQRPVYFGAAPTASPEPIQLYHLTSHNDNAFFGLTSFRKIPFKSIHLCFN